MPETEQLRLTSEYPYGIYPFAEFNPVQTKVFEHLESNCNVVVASPTASGKTICGEILAGRELYNGKRIVYTSPLKALAEEKYRDWTEATHPWVGYPSIVMTGDYRLTEARERELDKAKIIISTFEMLAVRARRGSIEKNGWLDEVGALVIDEAHFIGSPDRGDHLEAALIGFTRRNPSARIIFLSATFPNADTVTHWLSLLNGNPTEVVSSTWRPCQLTINFQTYDSPRGGGKGWYAAMEEAKIDATIAAIQNNPEDQWLVFVHSKTTGKKVLAKLRALGKEVAYHNADLEHGQRMAVEEGFRSGVVRYLVATSTLAYGLNLPARRVAIVGVERGMNTVEVSDIIQECGRAGRPKFDTVGDAYLVLERKQRFLWEKFLRDGINVQSCLQRKVGFHLIGEIAEKRVVDHATAEEWAGRTLSVAQKLWNQQAVHHLFEKFVEVGLVTLTRAGFEEDAPKVYQPTKLGKLASLHYFDPFDVANWKSNFGLLGARELMRNDVALAWAMANVETRREGYVPADLKIPTSSYLSRLKALNIFISGDEALVYATVFDAMMNGTKNVLDNAVPFVRAIRGDLDRMLGCLCMLNRIMGRYQGDPYWVGLRNRLLYGVGWEAAELCALPGIGKVYSERLVSSGINSIEDFYRNKHIARAVLPEDAYDKALTHFKDREKSW